MYAVTGSTGQVGGAVVRALLAQGRQVRALLRDPAKAAALQQAGAETFVVDMEDPSHVEQAFTGVEGVFVMTPPLLSAPDPRGEHEMMLATITHALQAAHVPRVVFLSSIGAELDEGTGPILKTHDMEQALFALPLEKAAIRAAYFMENLVPAYGHAKESGHLPVLIEPLDKSLAMVATRDIGELAAELLTAEWTGQRILELEGPRQYSMQDAAAVLSRQAAREIVPVLVPREQRAAMFEQFGASPKAAEDMVEMSDGMSQGLIAFAGGAGIEHQQGATTLEQVFSKL
ncbi:NmrA family NAD(P)-binding protein [Acidipila sp. EB88]|uniref:NmrA family NAD(P)-binding protein n=1 Tax=Acidipila sp. EB88 TaxID=2305226 RepID=UPI000F5FA5FA|nr:NmrA family NAD(P)-binding protein [Acidipila sp. EB88]RRA47925.1 NAD-dependent epimerase/dehydratase family protein [Acidipila sp. EB88]